MRKLQNSSSGSKFGVGDLEVQASMLPVRSEGPSQQPRERVRSDSKSNDVPKGMIPSIYWRSVRRSRGSCLVHRRTLSGARSAMRTVIQPP